MKVDIKAILIVIFASSLLGLIYNYFSLSGIPLIAEEKKLNWAEDSLFSGQQSGLINNQDSIKERGDGELSLKKGEREQQQKQMKKNVTDEKPKIETSNKEKELSEPAAIHIKQAYNLYQQNVLFIDAREPADYQNAHIKNAVNIPFDHFDEYKHLLNDIDKEKIIVTYCAGTDCDLSKLLGNMLFEMGYKKVYIFFGGWNEWLEASYPVEKEN